MNVPSRAFLAVLFGISILALVLLSAGLPNVELQTSMAYDPLTRQELAAAVYELPDLTVLFIIMTALLFVMWLIALIFFPKAASEQRRKRNSLQQILAYLFLILLLISLRQFTQEEGAEGEDIEAPEINPSFSMDDSLEPGLPPIPEAAPDPPPWLGFVVSFTLLTAALGTAAFFWLRRPPPETALEAIGEEARAALNELRYGEDLRNVILRCYLRMCSELDRQQGIRRREGMTPREFEERLLAAGFPSVPVTQLTRLFEKVRYGAKATGPEEERQATECLTAILEASGRTS